MKKISDLQIGKAGEYLVCADLILKGFVSFPSEQGLPFDVVMDYKGKLIKIQVKTTREKKYSPQRKSDIPVYIFNVGKNGKMNKNKKYNECDVDIFALVSLDTKRISYIHRSICKTTMIFRVPELRGSYHDEAALQIKSKVIALKQSGKSCPEIAKELNMKLSNVYKYSANISLIQKGTNAGVYFDELTLEKCLKIYERE